MSIHTDEPQRCGGIWRLPRPAGGQPAASGAEVPGREQRWRAAHQPVSAAISCPPGAAPALPARSTRPPARRNRRRASGTAGAISSIPSGMSVLVVGSCLPLPAFLVHQALARCGDAPQPWALLPIPLHVERKIIRPAWSSRCQQDSRPLMAVFPLFRCGRARLGPTARSADRAVLVDFT